MVREMKHKVEKGDEIEFNGLRFTMEIVTNGSQSSPMLLPISEQPGLEKAIEEALKENSYGYGPQNYKYNSIQVGYICKKVVTDLINHLSNLIEKEASIDDIHYAVEVAKWCGK